ncbi:MAG: DUF2797 domain-containing protein [Candidatus Thorarchaeota archaeon]
MHIVRINWKSEGESFTPGLVVWHKDAPELDFEELKIGDDISWTIRGPRKCIGRRLTEKEFVRCPSDNVIQCGQIKCSSCNDFDYFDPCVRCTGDVCHATAERYEVCNKTPYVVYAAIFNNGLLKVGVSTTKRVLTRWVEQGADYAGILVNVIGGKKARQIEHELGTHPGIATSVTGRQKQEMLTSELSLQAAYDLLHPLKDLHSLIERDLELKDLSGFYGISKMDTEPHKWFTTVQQVPGLQIAGEIIGMKGSLLITKISGAFYVISLKSILGYTIDCESDVTIVTQSGLLDFI